MRAFFSSEPALRELRKGNDEEIVDTSLDLWPN
jgi:hypothetical protein